MAGIRPKIPDDTVFFALYPSSESANDEELQRLRTECLEVAFPLVDGYIWQHQPFDLALSTSSYQCPCNSPPYSDDGAEWELPTTSSASLAPSVPHLHGKVKYGDNIEDEWFVVYLLYAISRQFPSLSIRVWDTDGEFLLIEAAYSIPRWLKPENSWNRVFIRQGCLHILPLPRSPAELYHLPMKPSVKDAVQVLSSGAVNTRAADAVQAAIQRRLDSYGKNSKNNMHNVRCRVPLPVAQILKHEPQLISLVVEAFYDRDLDSMTAAARMEKFVPNGLEGQVEMVDVVVRMSRAMYAQLVQQVFQAPRCYPMPPLSDPHYKEAELGMKLTCGLEMMYWERIGYEQQVSGGESEVGKQTEKVASKDIGWQTFLTSLQHTGYFRGLLEGSKEYRELMDAAMARYQQTSLFLRVSTAMHVPIRHIKEILALPHSIHDFADPQGLQSDDDSWLYSGEEDLTNAMLERQKEIDMYKSKRARRKEAASCDGGSSVAKTTTVDFNPEDVPKSMQSFINKISSFEGAEFPSDDDKNKAHDDSVSISMGRFLKELKSAFGSNGELQHSGQEENSIEEMDTSSSDIDFDDNESEKEEDMVEEECPSTSHVEWETEEREEHVDMQSGKQGGDVFMDEYSEALSRELRSSSLAKSFARVENSSVATEKEKGALEDEEGLPPVNIDLNLLQSLLESYSSQQGLPGPASNLLGVMGLHLPDDSKEKKNI